MEAGNDRWNYYSDETCTIYPPRCQRRQAADVLRLRGAAIEFPGVTDPCVGL